MSRKLIALPNGRLLIREWEDTYKYLYAEVKENRWVKRRRWEKHVGYEGGRPHIHYYDDAGFSDKFQIKFSARYDLRKVLEEIKKDFDASIDVEATILETSKGDRP
jgi:hypothetical protein